MKLVALALALLLAVGSQAASLQADAPVAPPSELQHIRGMIDTFLTQLQTSYTNALNGLEDAELKASLQLRMDNFVSQIKVLQTSVSPVTDSVFTTIKDATAELRASITADINSFKTQMDPAGVELKKIGDLLLAEINTKLTPILTAEMDSLKTKLDPIMTSLQEKFTASMNQVKTIMEPIVESVRTKMMERLEAGKKLIEPYATEYREQLQTAFTQAHEIDTAELQKKVQPLADDIKAKLNEIFEIIAASVTKN